MIAAIRSQLFSFHSHVNKLSKVLIEGGDRHILSHGGGDQTVDSTRKQFPPYVRCIRSSGGPTQKRNRLILREMLASFCKK